MEGDLWGSFGHDPGEPAVADLQRRAEDTWLEDRRNAFFGFMGPTLICWTIYLGINWGDLDFGEHFPWPLIVMAATFLNLLKTLTTREEIVASEVRRLERKQAKELDKLREP